MPITDLQNQPIWKQYLGSDRDVEIRGTARGVSADNFEGMSEILTSPLVSVLEDISNGGFRRLSVKVQTLKVVRETRDGFLDFEVSFILPTRTAQK